MSDGGSCGIGRWPIAISSYVGNPTPCAFPVVAGILAGMRHRSGNLDRTAMRTLCVIALLNLSGCMAGAAGLCYDASTNPGLRVLGDVATMGVAELISASNKARGRCDPSWHSSANDVGGARRYG